MATKKIGVDYDFQSVARITGLQSPTGATDAATRGYVEGLINGTDWKESVRVATTAAGTLATSFANGQTVDGVSLVTGDRILIKNQAAGAENGIYTVNGSGAPTRATDADSSAEVTGGLAVFVNQGTTNGNSQWMLTTDDPITLGTTALTFTQFGAGSSYSEGTGIDITGNTISLETPVTVANGGTGSGTVTGARTNLGAMGRFTQAIGDAAATSFTLTHNFNTRAVVVGVARTGSPYDEVDCYVTHATVNTVVVEFNTAPASNEFTATVIG